MQTILLQFYIYIKCLYSQHAHKVLSAMLSAVHSHKKRPYLVHSTSHPVSSSPLPQLLLLFGSLSTTFLLLSFILTFYAVSVCFWLQKPLKRRKLCRTCAHALCFPSYPPHLLALAIQLISICIYMSKN